MGESGIVLGQCHDIARGGLSNYFLKISLYPYCDAWLNTNTVQRNGLPFMSVYKPNPDVTFILFADLIIRICEVLVLARGQLGESGVNFERIWEQFWESFAWGKVWINGGI